MHARSLSESTEVPPDIPKRVEGHSERTAVAELTVQGHTLDGQLLVVLRRTGARFDVGEILEQRCDPPTVPELAPYPNRVLIGRSLARLHRSMGSVVWLFPGQGSQRVGMSRELAERYPSAMLAFDEASHALNLDLKALAWNGSQTALDQTANTQPTLLTASIAALRAAQEAGVLAEPLALMGHSLGEFTALVAGGALALADAVRLVRKRGELMQAADASGGMLAVLGLDADAITRAIANTGIVVANDNAPGQVVISGPRAQFVAATAALKQAGAKRVIPLKTSGAFHSPTMRKVAPDLAAALNAVTWTALRLPIIANVDAALHEHAADFPELLEKQVWSPVQWVTSMRRAGGEGATAFVEFGPGNVLTGLAKRILPDARTANVSEPKTLEEALTVLR
jgi:[acyl-carrier-protein] S-malonyltransferase